jgi:hypothetical protein
MREGSSKLHRDIIKLKIFKGTILVNMLSRRPTGRPANMTYRRREQDQTPENRNHRLTWESRAIMDLLISHYLNWFWRTYVITNVIRYLQAS